MSKNQQLLVKFGKTVNKVSGSIYLLKLEGFAYF